MENTLRKFLVPAILLVRVSSVSCQPPSSPALQTTLRETSGSWTVETAGLAFAAVRASGLPRPVVWPVRGPSGLTMTRRWPMEESTDEEHDHPHHRGVWFAHGDVNGVDFWSEGPASGRIVVEKDEAVGRTDGSAELRSRSRWVGPGGDLVCRDRRTMLFAGGPGWRTIDFEIALEGTDAEVRLGDTKEGTMAIRLAEPLRVKGGRATGHYLSSEGLEDGAVWGKRAAWVDAWGTIDGKAVGVAVFDHPQNPRHPTWWHARDYGLFAANPFGVHDFEKKPRGTGDFVIPKGEAATWKWRFLFHDGAPDEAKIRDRWTEWSTAPKKEQR